MTGAELLRGVMTLDPLALMYLAAMAGPVAPADEGLVDELNASLRDELAKLMTDGEEV